MSSSANKHIEVIREVERFHFWHAPRRALFIEIIQQYAPAGCRLLDIGCATGALCCELRERGYTAVGLDLAPVPVREGMGWQVAGDATCLPWASDSFDVVCVLDLLEHVDDQSCLAEILRVLKPGGLVVASVPAFQGLWSERDAAAGHLRRYGRREFRSLLEHAGFGVEQLFGFQCFLLPVVALSRWIQRLRGTGGDQLRHEDRPGPVVNGIFRFINEAEVAIGRLLRPPVGSSLVAVVRKPGS